MLKGALKATVAYAVFMAGLSVPAFALAQNGAPLPGATAGAMPLAGAPALTATVTTTTATPKSLPASSTTTTTVSTTAPAPGTPAVGTTFVSPSLPESGGIGTGGSALTQSPPTPRIVQDAMNGLQKTDPINLDDMIRAQDAINRLDLLLEIEKRQTELKKLRDERNKVAGMGSIPSSALNLPPMRVSTSSSLSALNIPPSMGGASMVTIPPPPVSSGGYSLKRIVGTEGRYSAVLGEGDKIVSVRTGETLADGSKVKSITLTSVSLVKDKKSKTLTIPSDSYIVRGSEELIP